MGGKGFRAVRVVLELEFVLVLGAVLPAAFAVTRVHQKANTDQSQTPAIEFEDEFEDDFLYLVSQRVSARH